MSGRWVGSTRRSRLPADWPAIRAAILKRDNWTCYLCGRPGADGVDHVQRGDDHSPGNLAAVHDRQPPHCHRFKSSSEGNAARPRQRRAPERHPGLR